MRPSIGRGKVAQVLKLVSGGMSQRQAARVAGVSKSTAHHIVNGQHVSQFSEDSGEVAFHTCPEYACPTCRRLVTSAPCPVCVARRGR